MVGPGEKIVPLMILCPGRNGGQKVKGQGSIGSMRGLKSQEGEGTLECPASLNDFQLDLMTFCLEALVIVCRWNWLFLEEFITGPDRFWKTSDRQASSFQRRERVGAAVTRMGESDRSQAMV